MSLTGVFTRVRLIRNEPYACVQSQAYCRKNAATKQNLARFLRSRAGDTMCGAQLEKQEECPVSPRSQCEKHEKTQKIAFFPVESLEVTKKAVPLHRV